MRNISVKKKTTTYFIDWIVIIALYGIGMSLFMVLWYFFCFVINKLEIINTDAVYNIIYYSCLVFSVLIYPLFKDLIFECGSIGCKLSKVKIINENGIKPTKKQLLLRGLLFHIFWIDFFVAKRRLDNCSLTDIITKTRQVYLFDNC